MVRMTNISKFLYQLLSVDKFYAKNCKFSVSLKGSLDYVSLSVRYTCREPLETDKVSSESER